jgi:hypothetical protein
MRFMVLRKADPKTEAGALPTPELLAAMGRYVESLARAGVLLGGDGLKQSAKGARVLFHRGKPMVTDGPFTETKELLAGFLLIRVASLAEAIEWARKWPTVDGDGEVALEIRELVEAGDFGREHAEAMDKIKSSMPG